MTHFRAEVLICVWIFFPLEWIKSVFFFPPFMLRCSRLLQCLPVNSWRDLFLLHEMHAFFCSMSQSWPGRAKPFRVSLFPLVWFPLRCQSSSVPVSHAGTQDSLAGLVFPWFCPNWRKLCMFPRPPLCPNYGKLAFTFLITGMGCVWVRSPRQTTKNDLNQGNLRNI